MSFRVGAVDREECLVEEGQTVFANCGFLSIVPMVPTLVRIPSFFESFRTSINRG